MADRELPPSRALTRALSTTPQEEGGQELPVEVRLTGCAAQPQAGDFCVRDFHVRDFQTHRRPLQSS